MAPPQVRFVPMKKILFVFFWTAGAFALYFTQIPWFIAAMANNGTSTRATAFCASVLLGFLTTVIAVILFRAMFRRKKS